MNKENYFRLRPKDYIISPNNDVSLNVEFAPGTELNLLPEQNFTVHYNDPINSRRVFSGNFTYKTLLENGLLLTIRKPNGIETLIAETCHRIEDRPVLFKLPDPLGYIKKIKAGPKGSILVKYISPIL